MGEVVEVLGVPGGRAFPGQRSHLDLLQARILQLRPLGQGLAGLVGQANPDDAGALRGQMGAQAELGRDRQLRLRRHAGAAAVGPIPEAMVGAHDLVPFDPAEAQRHAAVQAQVACGDDLSGRTVEHQLLVEQRDRARPRAHLAREAHRMPEVGQDRPVLGREGAAAWKVGGRDRHGRGSCCRSRSRRRASLNRMVEIRAIGAIDMVNAAGPLETRTLSQSLGGARSARSGPGPDRRGGLRRSRGRDLQRRAGGPPAAGVEPRPLAFKGVAWPRGASVREQLASLRRETDRLQTLGPGSLSVIGGQDCWSDDEAARYFEGALRLEQRLGLPMAHETHRNSALFHPAPPAGFSPAFPS